MATYINGVTDYVPQIQQFTPDYNFNQSVLTVKQQKYDQGLQQVSSLYGSALDMDLTRDDNQIKKQEFFKDIDKGIKKLAGLDLSLRQNIEQAYGLFNQFLNDKEIQHDAMFTKVSKDELQKAQAFKNCLNPDECGGEWWEGGERLIQLSMMEYKDASAEDALNMTPQEFVPAQNVWKIATDIMKEIDPKKSVEYVESNKEFIVKDENGEIVNNEVSALLTGILGNDQRIQNYYKAQAKLERLEYVSVMKDQLGSVDLANAAYYGQKLQDLNEAFGMVANSIDVSDENKGYLERIQSIQQTLQKSLKDNEYLLKLSQAVAGNNTVTLEENIETALGNAENETPIQKQIRELFTNVQAINTSLNTINMWYELAKQNRQYIEGYGTEILDSQIGNMLLMFDIDATMVQPLSNIWSIKQTKLRPGSRTSSRGGSGARTTYTYGADGSIQRVVVNAPGVGSVPSNQNNSSSGRNSSFSQTRTGNNQRVFGQPRKFGGQLRKYQDEGEVKLKSEVNYPFALPKQNQVWGIPAGGYVWDNPNYSQLFDYNDGKPINEYLEEDNSYRPIYPKYEGKLIDYVGFSKGVSGDDTTSKTTTPNISAPNSSDSDAAKKLIFEYRWGVPYASFANAYNNGIWSTALFEGKGSTRVYNELLDNYYNKETEMDLSGSLFRTEAPDGYKNPHAGSMYRNYDVTKNGGKVDAGNLLLQETQETYNNHIQEKISNIQSRINGVINLISNYDDSEELIKSLVDCCGITGSGSLYYDPNTRQVEVGYSKPQNIFDFNTDEKTMNISGNKYQNELEFYNAKEILSKTVQTILMAGNYNNTAVDLINRIFVDIADYNDYVNWHHNYVNDLREAIESITDNEENIRAFFGVDDDVDIIKIVGFGATKFPKIISEGKGDNRKILDVTDKIDSYNKAKTNFNLIKQFINYNDYRSRETETPGSLLFSSCKGWNNYIMSEDAKEISTYFSDEIDGLGNITPEEGEAEDRLRMASRKESYNLSPLELELMHNALYESSESDVKDYNNAIEKAWSQSQEKFKSNFNGIDMNFDVDNQGMLTIDATINGVKYQMPLTSQEVSELNLLINENSDGDIEKIINNFKDFCNNHPEKIISSESTLTLPNENGIIQGNNLVSEIFGRAFYNLVNDRTETMYTNKTGMLGTITDKYSMMNSVDDRPDFEPFNIFGGMFGKGGKDNRYQLEDYDEDVSVNTEQLLRSFNGLYSLALDKEKARFLDPNDPCNAKEGYGKTYYMDIKNDGIKSMGENVQINYLYKFFSQLGITQSDSKVMFMKINKNLINGQESIERWPLVSEDLEVTNDGVTLTTDETIMREELNNFIKTKPNESPVASYHCYISPIGNDDQRYMAIHFTDFVGKDGKPVKKEDFMNYDGITVYVPYDRVMKTDLAMQYRNNLLGLTIHGAKTFDVESTGISGAFHFEREGDTWYLRNTPFMADFDIDDMFNESTVSDKKYLQTQLYLGNADYNMSPDAVGLIKNNENILSWRTEGIPASEFANEMRLLKQRLINYNKLFANSILNRIETNIRSQKQQ